jgi:dihydroflavonol-4-reductase
LAKNYFGTGNKNYNFVNYNSLKIMILVTGGTGLVGSHLLYSLLQTEQNVRVLIRPNSNRQNILNTFSYYSPTPNELYNKIEWCEGDIMDLVSLEEAMEGVDYVYHTAATVSFNPSHRKQMLQNNIQGTANVVNAALTKRIKKLCHVSSIAAIGSPVGDECSTEDLIWSPSKNKSAYSISKFHSEMEVWRGIEEGLQAVIVNPSVILGPGDWDRSSAALFSTIAKGLKFYTPGSTGYVDVRDVAKAMINLMNSDISGERFILNAENCTFKSVFQNIAKTLNVTVPSVEAKKWMAALAWRLVILQYYLFGKEPKITKETVQSGYKTNCYSSDKSISDTVEIFKKSKPL